MTKPVFQIPYLIDSLQLYQCQKSNLCSAHTLFFSSHRHAVKGWDPTLSLWRERCVGSLGLMGQPLAVCQAFTQNLSLTVPWPVLASVSPVSLDSRALPPLLSTGHLQGWRTGKGRDGAHVPDIPAIPSLSPYTQKDFNNECSFKTSLCSVCDVCIGGVLSMLDK